MFLDTKTFVNIANPRWKGINQTELIILFNETNLPVSVYHDQLAIHTFEGGIIYRQRCFIGTAP